MAKLAALMLAFFGVATGQYCSSYGSCTDCTEENACAWCWGYVDGVPEGSCIDFGNTYCYMANLAMTPGQCPYAAPSPSPYPPPPNPNGGGSTPASNPVSTFVTVTVTIGVILAVFVVASLITFGALRCMTMGKGLSPAEATAVFLYRVGIVQIIIGVVGIFASFSFLCSVLTLASGAVLVATMGSFNDAQAIALGRKAACSAPHHAMNLAIAALVFGLLELIGYVTLYAELVAFVIIEDNVGNGRRLQNNGEEVIGYTSFFYVVAIYATNAITLSLLESILNITVIAMYCQVMGALGGSAVVCGGSTQVTIIAAPGGFYGQQPQQQGYMPPGQPQPQQPGPGYSGRDDLSAPLVPPGYPPAAAASGSINAQAP